ncbi:hypothetical protein F7R91_05270 [Streptomyces luteolifulvus]|jgi:hypothetical protein|uniref:Uncharacterized protein n=1 Tax=Streptomyces luteolifulvus TaxID=2615112 RepID=A0A6H9V976_9ACTN|nr:hypothetical protein [Streptomyces luteolifulvus]KAB1149176.1 hypothetical protein F7R91_05270 [Streptomyces luteolifulvus]
MRNMSILAASLFGWDWGNVPAWVGTASVVLAAIAYRRSVRDQKMAQARKIAAWVIGSAHGDTESDHERQPELLVSNSSDASIFELKVRDGITGQTLCSPISEVPATSKARHRMDLADDAEVQAIWAAAMLGMIVVWASSESTDIDVDLLEMPLRMEFRDAQGMWWKRDSSGKVRPLRLSIPDRLAFALTRWSAKKAFRELRKEQKVAEKVNEEAN